MKRFEVMCYVLAIAALVAMVFAIIQNKPTGAISCLLSAIALFLSGRNANINERNKAHIKELCDIINGLCEMKREELEFHKTGIIEV